MVDDIPDVLIGNSTFPWFHVVIWWDPVADSVEDLSVEAPFVAFGVHEIRRRHVGGALGPSPTPPVP